MRAARTPRSTWLGAETRALRGSGELPVRACASTTSRLDRGSRRAWRSGSGAFDAERGETAVGRRRRSPTGSRPRRCRSPWTVWGDSHAPVAAPRMPRLPAVRLRRRPRRALSEPGVIGTAGGSIRRPVIGARPVSSVIARQIVDIDRQREQGVISPSPSPQAMISADCSAPCLSREAEIVPCRQGAGSPGIVHARRVDVRLAEACAISCSAIFRAYGSEDSLVQRSMRPSWNVARYPWHVARGRAGRRRAGASCRPAAR